MSSSTVLPARLGPPDTAAVPALAGAAADVFAALLFEHAVSDVPVASVNATSRAARRRGDLTVLLKAAMTGIPFRGPERARPPRLRCLMPSRRADGAPCCRGLPPGYQCSVPWCGRWAGTAARVLAAAGGCPARQVTRVRSRAGGLGPGPSGSGRDLRRDNTGSPFRQAGLP